MIAFLQANREHIGALLTTVVPYEGTVLVDPAKGKTSDGLIARNCVHTAYFELAAARMKESLERANSGPAGFLGALLGR